MAGKKFKKQSPTLDELVKDLGLKVSSITASPPYNRDKHNDETRSKISLYFVAAFFISIMVVLIGVPIYNIFYFRAGVALLDLKDILLAVSGTISGPLGFVIGHYFKSETR